jgi:hypothetical protein
LEANIKRRDKMHDPNGDYTRIWVLVASAGFAIAIALAANIVVQNLVYSI